MGARVSAVSLKGSAVPMPMLNVSRPAMVSWAGWCVLARMTRQTHHGLGTHARVLVQLLVLVVVLAPTPAPGSAARTRGRGWRPPPCHRRIVSQCSKIQQQHTAPTCAAGLAQALQPLVLLGGRGRAQRQRVVLFYDWLVGVLAGNPDQQRGARIVPPTAALRAGMPLGVQVLHDALPVGTNRVSIGPQTPMLCSAHRMLMAPR